MRMLIILGIFSYFTKANSSEESNFRYPSLRKNFPTEGIPLEYHSAISSLKTFLAIRSLASVNFSSNGNS